MSDMHVLEADEDGRFKIVMHFAVPAGNNAAGVPFPTILVNAGRNTTVLPDGDGNAGTISNGEKTAIQNGTVREHVANDPIQSDGSTFDATQAALREFYAIEKTRSDNELTLRLPWFGRKESEA